MRSNMVGAISFIAGLVIGGGGVYLYFKDVYEERFQTELETEKAALQHDAKKTKDEESLDQNVRHAVTGNTPEPETNEFVEYAAKLAKSGYRDYSDTKVERPYVIRPDEFDDIPGYSTIELMYFSDGVLADEFYEKVENVDECVGIDSLSHFGEYEEDSVYVRNDARRCDYIIIREKERYKDVRKTMPHSPMED